MMFMATAQLTPCFKLRAKLVLMGVSGCGKSAIGEMLAHSLQARYLDGDDLHPVCNIEKMQQGIPLTDEDRWPWLTDVGKTLAHSPEPQIVGCSALKKKYRDHIRQVSGIPLLFVHLKGDMALIRRRMQGRIGHFMPVELLASQFAALEAPQKSEDAIEVDIDRSIPDIVQTILTILQHREQ